MHSMPRFAETGHESHQTLGLLAHAQCLRQARTVGTPSSAGYVKLRRMAVRLERGVRQKVYRSSFERSSKHRESLDELPQMRTRRAQPLWP